MNENNSTVTSAVKPATAPAAGAAPMAPRTGGYQGSRPAGAGSFGGGQGSFGGGARGKNPRKPGGRDARPKSEFDQKIIQIRRVTRVASGGRRFSFSVALVAGDKKGRVGVGIGKASDTSLAIDKAVKNAKKNMIKLNLSKTMSIPYELTAKYASSRVRMVPAPGKGMSAGSSVRNVIELAGINDVSAKIFSRSKNHLNNARAAIEALRELSKKKHAPVAPAAAMAPVAPAAKTA